MVCRKKGCLGLDPVLLTFCDLVQIHPNVISRICKKLASSHSKTFAHSYSFESPALSFNIFLPRYPVLSIGAVFGWLRSVRISSHLWFKSIYSPPISNWLWHHPVGRIHPVSFWVNYTFSCHLSYYHEVI